MPIKTQSVKISTLKKGDVVYHEGMRLELTEDAYTDPTWYVNENGPVFVAKALITNWEQVKRYVGNLAQREGDSRYWGMQSNERANWMKEEKS